MPTVCIQCSMRALLVGAPAPVFDEEPEAHATRCHADPIATAQERVMLEAQLRDHIQRQGHKP